MLAPISNASGEHSWTHVAVACSNSGKEKQDILAPAICSKCITSASFSSAFQNTLHLFVLVPAYIFYMDIISTTYCPSTHYISLGMSDTHSLATYHLLVSFIATLLLYKKCSQLHWCCLQCVKASHNKYSDKNDRGTGLLNL